MAISQNNCVYDEDYSTQYSMESMDLTHTLVVLMYKI